MNKKVMLVGLCVMFLLISSVNIIFAGSKDIKADVTLITNSQTETANLTDRYFEIKEENLRLKELVSQLKKELILEQKNRTGDSLKSIVSALTTENKQLKQLTAENLVIENNSLKEQLDLNRNKTNEIEEQLTTANKLFANSTQNYNELSVKYNEMHNIADASSSAAKKWKQCRIQLGAGFTQISIQLPKDPSNIFSNAKGITVPVFHFGVVSEPLGKSSVRIIGICSYYPGPGTPSDFNAKNSITAILGVQF